MKEPKNILEHAIDEHIQDIRYHVPATKKPPKRRGAISLILAIGVLLGLIISLLRLFG